MIRKSIMIRKLVAATVLSLISITPVLAKDVKIGVIDVQKAIMDTTMAKSMRDQFVKDFTKDEESDKKIQSEWKALNEKRLKASKTEQEAILKQMHSKKEAHNEIVNKIKQAEQERLQELRNAVTPKLKEVMKEIAAKGSYTIIVDKAAVPFYDEADDVTQQATEKLNQALK